MTPPFVTPPFVTPSDPPPLHLVWSSLLGHLNAHRSFGDGGGDGVSAAGEPVQVCVLTGFLGAGKSTLLAHLLAEPPEGLVIRAVVNDIGSLRFDPTLLADAGHVEVELTNGCGCCERIDELAITIDRLASGGAQRVRPDLLVVEASGVADPLALAQLVEARPLVRLDRIVTVVDASAVMGQLQHGAYGAILSRQLDAAHSVVITHADQLEPVELERVSEYIASLVPGRVIVASSPEAPASDVLLPTSSRGAGPRPHPATDRHDLVTIDFEQSAPIGRDRLEAALRQRPSGAVRGKGSLVVDGVPHHVQFTTTTWRVEPAPRLATEGRLTLVGTSSDALGHLVAQLGCS